MLTLLLTKVRYAIFIIKGISFENTSFYDYSYAYSNTLCLF